MDDIVGLPDPQCQFAGFRKIFGTFFGLRSMIQVFMVVGSIYVMNLANVFAFSQIQRGDPLPDIVADTWKAYGQLRGSEKYMSHQPVDYVSVGLGVTTAILCIFFWDQTNMRKTLIVYSICLLIRTIFFSVTTLPPPCAGYKRCPCHEYSFEEKVGNKSWFLVALRYSIGIGVNVGEIPQCGDLTMSGHSIFLWCLTLFISESFGRIFHGVVKGVLKGILFTIVTIITITIILIRNHYTIDILFAVTFTILVWMLYSEFQVIVRTPYSPAAKTLFGRIFMYFDRSDLEMTEPINPEPQNELFEP